MFFDWAVYTSEQVPGKFRHVVRMYIYTNSIQSSLLSHTNLFSLSHSPTPLHWLGTQVCVVYCVVSFSFWPLLFGRCCFILFALISLWKVTSNQAGLENHTFYNSSSLSINLTTNTTTLINSLD